MFGGLYFFSLCGDFLYGKSNSVHHGTDPDGPGCDQQKLERYSRCGRAGKSRGVTHLLPVYAPATNYASLGTCAANTIRAIRARNWAG